MTLVCPICNDRQLIHPSNGRPRSTCEGSCARVWAHARRNASRDKRIAVEALQRALVALGRTRSPNLTRELRNVLRRLDQLPPAELARVQALEQALEQ